MQCKLIATHADHRHHRHHRTMSHGRHFPLLAGLLVLLLACSPSSVSFKTDADVPRAEAEEVKSWALRFGDDIKDGSSAATCLRKITEVSRVMRKGDVEG